MKIFMKNVVITRILMKNIVITKIFLRNVVIMKIFMRSVVIRKIFIKNVVHNYNACRLAVCEIHNYILFCLHLAVILRNSVNNKFIKLVEQQLKIINYSELDPDFSFIINSQCHILNLNLNLILVQHL